MTVASTTNVAVMESINAIRDVGVVCNPIEGEMLEIIPILSGQIYEV